MIRGQSLLVHYHMYTGSCCIVKYRNISGNYAATLSHRRAANRAAVGHQTVQTPLEELKALPQTSKLDLRGPTYKGMEGEGR